jgi:hypothetical protein
MGGHSSNSQGNSTFSQTIPQNQQDALSSLYTQAGALFKASNDTSGYQGQLPAVDNYIQQINGSALPAYQQNLQGGAYQGMNIGSSLMDSINKSNAGPSNTQQIYNSVMGGAGNTSLDAMKSSLEQNAARSQGLNQASNAAQASAQGMSGSSRQGTYDALQNQLTNQNLQSTEAKLGYDTFNSDLQNKLGIAQAADSNTLSRQQMLSGMLGQQQGTINNALQQGSSMQNLGMGTFAPQMIPWQNLSNYSNAIGSPTILSNGNSSSSSKGGGGGLLTS